MGSLRAFLVVAMAGSVVVWARADEPAGPQKVPSSHLPNLYRLHPNVFSGGQPEGAEAFRELRQLGVKTIISVDGAKPDVEVAKKYGLRYVHLPHGYDGIPPARVAELAKAVRDLPGSIYIHCHHGKHRSPAAATVACVAVGWLQPSDAVTVLKTAGTSENYRGLYQSAAGARRLPDQVLDRLAAEFRETVPLPPMAEAMVEIEHTHDRLKAMAGNRWRPVPRHPDLSAGHEALLLYEHFKELARTSDDQRQSPAFQQLLRNSEAAAEELQRVFLDDQLVTQEATVPSATASWQRITTNCADCHRQFRDVPLSEK